MIVCFVIVLGEEVKGKWSTMRDYFVRPKRTTGSAATATKRDELMAFLLDTSILKRRLVLRNSIPQFIQCSFSFLSQNLICICFQFTFVIGSTALVGIHIE